MNELTRALDQLNRSYRGEAWHGEALLELLKDTPAEKAAARPIPNGHSIWELAQHLAVWLEIVAMRIRSGSKGANEPEDWKPIVDVSEDAWRGLLARLETAQNEMEKTLRSLDQESFVRKLPDVEFGPDFLVYGLAQHAAYHGGQIALLKKALS